MVKAEYSITHERHNSKFIINYFNITITDDEDIFRLNPVLIYDKPIFLPLDWTLMIENSYFPSSNGCINKAIVDTYLHYPAGSARESFTIRLVNLVCKGCSLLHSGKISGCKAYIRYNSNQFYKTNDFDKVAETFLKSIVDNIQESWQIAVQKAKMSKYLPHRSVIKRF